MAVLIQSQNGQLVPKPSLAAAIASADVAGKTIVVTESVTLAVSDTVPVGTALRVENGGLITINSGQALTINGSFECGLYQAFGGTGTVTFGAGAVNEVYPEWWGVDGVADDIQINAAIASLPAVGGVVRLGFAQYHITASINIGDGTSTTKSTTTNIRLTGAGVGGDQTCVVGYQDGTYLKWTGSAGGTVIKLNGPISGTEISNMTIDGKSSASTALDLYNPQFSTFRNIVICNMAATAGNLYAEYAVRLRAVPTTVTSQVSRGAISNTFDKLIIRYSASIYNGMIIGDGVKALNDGSANATVWDALQNIFTNCTFTANSDNVTYRTSALTLSFTDNSSFYQCLVTHFWNSQAITDYGCGLRIMPPEPSRHGNTDDIFMAQSFPCEIGFYNTAIIHGVETDTSLLVSGGGTAYTPVNYAGIAFYNFPITDGETFPSIDGVWGYTSRGEYHTPKALGYRGAIITANTAQTISTGIQTVLNVFSTAQSNDDFIWSASTPSVFRAVKAGLYQISLTMNWASNGTGARKVQITKASTIGGSYTEIKKSLVAPLTGAVTSNDISYTCYLPANYYIRFEVTQTSGGNLDVSQYAEAAIVRLR